MIGYPAPMGPISVTAASEDANGRHPPRDAREDKRKLKIMLISSLASDLDAMRRPGPERKSDALNHHSPSLLITQLIHIWHMRDISRARSRFE